MATIREVARLAGVSSGTVSNYLRNPSRVSSELRRRIEIAIKRLDYQPDEVARSLKSKKTKTLGFIFPDSSNPFFPQVARGAADAALELGYLMTSFTVENDAHREGALFAALRGRKVDGVLIASDSEDHEHVADAIARGVRIVAVNRVPRGLGVDSVSAENCAGARDAVLHLAGLGRRRIALLGRRPILSTVRERLAGYKVALRRVGLPLDPGLVQLGVSDFAAAYEATRKLLLAPSPPDAIFATNAVSGHAALKALRDGGVLCPEQVALAMFDDVDVDHVLGPAITSVVQPAYEMGREAARLLIARLNGGRTERRAIRIRLPVELVVRDSSSQNRAHSAI